MISSRTSRRSGTWTVPTGRMGGKWDPFPIRFGWTALKLGRGKPGEIRGGYRSPPYGFSKGLEGISNPVRSSFRTQTVERGSKEIDVRLFRVTDRSPLDPIGSSTAEKQRPDRSDRITRTCPAQQAASEGGPYDRTRDIHRTAEIVRPQASHRGRSFVRDDPHRCTKLCLRRRNLHHHAPVPSSWSHVDVVSLSTSPRVHVDNEEPNPPRATRVGTNHVASWDVLGGGAGVPAR